MKNLDLLPDDELERLKRQENITPIGGLTNDQMLKILRALGGNEDDDVSLKTRVDKTMPETNDAGKLVFGVGYIQTEKGTETGIVGCRITKKK